MQVMHQPGSGGRQRGRLAADESAWWLEQGSGSACDGPPPLHDTLQSNTGSGFRV